LFNVFNDKWFDIYNNQINRIFRDFDRDLDGYLTEDDFVKFYRDSAVTSPDLVEMNLK